MDYWTECVSTAFDEAGITATEQQIADVAEHVEGAYENYGMAHGHDAIPNPLEAENKRLSRELKAEQDKEICEECRGRGRIITPGPYHSSNSECFRCRGNGFIYR